MASGKTHARITVAAAPIAGGAAFILTGFDVLNGLLAWAGCLSGVVLSPDLDQEGVTRSEWWVIRRTLGLGWLWVLYWWPYAWKIRHRSWWSHAPLVGTMGRVAYCSVPFVLLIWYFQPNMQPEDLAFLLPMIAGLAVSDTLHWLFDI